MPATDSWEMVQNGILAVFGAAPPYTSGKNRGISGILGICAAPPYTSGKKSSNLGPMQGFARLGDPTSEDGAAKDPHFVHIGSRCCRISVNFQNFPIFGLGI